MVKFGQEKKFFILLCLLSFTVFSLTSDGHRYTIDEDMTQQQSMWIATMTPDPRFIPGESRELFQFPELYPNNPRPICNIGILCSQVPIGATVVQVPFIILNQNFNLITHETTFFTVEDFPDPHYVFWRNSQNPDYTFLELFFGPTFMALSVGLLFLISRTYSLSTKTSIILSILFAFSTSVWAYSQTSLNIVPATFFILLGFYFFRKFILTRARLNLIFSATALGFGFLVRNDVILYIIPLFVFLIFNLIQNSDKIRNVSKTRFLSFVLPLISAYIIELGVRTIRTGVGVVNEYTGLHEEIQYRSVSYFGIPSLINIFQSPACEVGKPCFYFIQSAYGLLFSPGVGLLIFCPILITMFYSFFDFYKKNKSECILFISFIAIVIFFYSNNQAWHGLQGWGARYLTTLIPFLLIPLGFSIEKIQKKAFKIILAGLGILGIIFNLSYIVTDVSWFIWGLMGSGVGLYELGHEPLQSLWIHPAVLWTFDYSQLTHSLKYMLTFSQIDIFLLKAWGLYFYSIFSIASLSILTYLIIRLNKKSTISVKKL